MINTKEIIWEKTFKNGWGYKQHIYILRDFDQYWVYNEGSRKACFDNYDKARSCAVNQIKEGYC